VFAAILFFIGNLLFLVYYVAAIKNTENVHDSNFLELDPSYIKEVWVQRNEMQTLYIASSMINAGAWSIFAMPILQLAWILSFGGKRRMALHISIVVLVVGAVMSEFLALLFSLGMSNVTTWVILSMNLSNWTSGSTPDNIGFRVVELCSFIFNGMVLWIGTFEWLALSVSLLLIYLSTRGLANAGAVDGHEVSFTFGKCWAHFGLFISFMAFIDFTSQVLQILLSENFTNVGILIGIFNRLVLFPLWLCCLGKQLTVAAQSIEITKNFNLHQSQMEQDQREQDSGIEMGATNNEDDATVDIPLSN